MAKSGYRGIKEWRAKNPEKKAAQDRRYNARHPETARKAKSKFRELHLDEIRKTDAAQAQIRRARDPEGQRRRMAVFKDRQRASQDKIAGRPRPDHCELCGEARKVVFDHCHARGHFRGWICDRCNKVLGLLRDSPALARQMASYLERTAFDI